MAVKKPTKKSPAKSRTGSSKSKLNSLPKVNKWLALLFVAVIAGVGAYIIFRANAATNNCQAVDAVQICDVDMALGSDVTVLSTGGWADSLGKAGFWYFGAVFRAPTSAYAGSVPISAVYTESATYRDYMTVAQKSLKDSAFPGKTKNEGVAFYAWENPGQPDTVPVYRITQGGAGTKTFYSTDLGTINRLLAEGQNDPNGWKKDQFAGSSFIAFYAYPPNYAVAKQPNPYDCSILANYASDRCAGSRAALETAIAAGNVPVGKDCPATLEIYRKAPFASQFDQACQDKWNNYMNDCSVQENFVSDRCKKERQAFVDAQAEQARQREAAAVALRRVPSSKSVKPGTAGGGSTPGGCTLGVDTCRFLAECSANGCPNFTAPTIPKKPGEPKIGFNALLLPRFRYLYDNGWDYYNKDGKCTISYDSRWKVGIGLGWWRPEKQIYPSATNYFCDKRKLDLYNNEARNVKRVWKRAWWN